MATIEIPISQLARKTAKSHTEPIDAGNIDNKIGKTVGITTMGCKVNTYESELIQASIEMNSWLILFSVLGFVASFAISIGPVMWVLFSELFPNAIRGLAISFVGLINSAISFMVQWIFPWELEVLGNSTTFFIYGAFAVLGLIFIIRVIPETKGKSLEELEEELVYNR